jgi:hypothetical protein
METEITMENQDFLVVFGMGGNPYQRQFESEKLEGGGGAVCFLFST